MDLFRSAEDFGFFLNTLKKHKDETNTQIFAYCLMDNHVHLLLKCSDKNLPVYMKKIEVSFSKYFNKINEHVGHVFQDRYNSEGIDTERYFWCAFRYIIRNPESAGMCKWREYHWSSATDLLLGTSQGATDIKYLTEMPGGLAHLIKIIDAPIDRKFIEPESFKKAFTDSEARIVIEREAEACGFRMGEKNDKNIKNCFICNVLNCGISVCQLERISGITHSTIRYNYNK